MSRRAIDAVWVVGLAAVIVLFVALAFGLGPDNDVFRSYDYREIFRYQKAFYRAALLDGRMPLWTPHTFSGWPFAANPLTQTFYPPVLLALTVPPPQAAAVDVVFHLVLAACGTWLLLRRCFVVARGSAAFGGLAFACTGTIVAHTYAGHVPYYAAIAYIPWLLVAADRACGTGRVDVRWISLGAAALALQILSGGFPFTWLAVLLLLLYRAGDLLCRPDRSRLWREGVVLALIILGGLGLAAVQLVPSFELAGLSNRADLGWEYAAQLSLPPELLINLAYPGAFGGSHEPFWEYYGYVGVLPLTLAAAGASRARAEPRVVVLVAVAVSAVLFAVGSHGFLYPLLWQYVPGFGLFRGPARALSVFALAIALLAAIGLDALCGVVAKRRRRRAAAPLLVAFACALVFADLTVAAHANRERLWVTEAVETPGGVHPQMAALLERDRGWYRFWFPRAYFRENHSYALGAHSIGGYDTVHLARYGRFVHHMTDTPYSPLVTILDPRMFPNAPAPFPFKVLGVKYAWGRDQRLHGREEPVRRAWFVTRACRVADEQAALARMRQHEFEAEREVVFEAAEADRLGVDAASCAGAAAPVVDVEVEETSPERLRIKLGPHPRGYVVLSEIHYPGWRAAVGGRSVPIHRADSILRAVPVDEGDTEIEMTFAPSSLRWGAAISLATVVLLSVALWRARAAPSSSAE